ncbi:hypothetical protein SCLCIDRAFT_773944 [Scleroderma citrinum Foug A]|uniref:Uncharacterized protein n=1 Tax=Scleroderma citrinum Foug A TaxID=1036808 RepID=A0A0C3DQT8_9AGAM|nr:hypothetical protein SCLCIDRAFT_773944 [Scleroderma citrinum Foug A]
MPAIRDNNTKKIPVNRNVRNKQASSGKLEGLSVASQDFSYTTESEYPTDDIRRTLFRTKEGKVSVLSWHTVFDVEETITVESNRVSMGSI